MATNALPGAGLLGLFMRLLMGVSLVAFAFAVLAGVPWAVDASRLLARLFASACLWAGQVLSDLFIQPFLDAVIS